MVSVSFSAEKNDFSNQVKSVFVYNFLDFVSWPSVDIKASPTICVLAEDKFFQILEYIRRETAQSGQGFVLKKMNNSTHLSECQIAYIHHSHAKQLDVFFANTLNKPILTVSDIRGFVNRGGIVGFIEKGNKIRLEVNNTLASKNKIKISSKLLKLAENIK